MPQDKKPHIVLQDAPQTLLYTTTNSSRHKRILPYRDRTTHGNALQKKLQQAWLEAERVGAAIRANRQGMYLEFISDPGEELRTKSLEDMRSKKIRLLNIREVKVEPLEGDGNEQTQTHATIYLANDYKHYFEKKVDDYLRFENESGKPRNQDLIDSISNIRIASEVDSFWSDDPALIPRVVPEWIEVWLSGEGDNLIADFETLLAQYQIRARPGVIRFPERIVKVIRASRAHLETLSSLFDHIAEYRSAKSTAAFFMGLESYEQAAWVDNLLERTSFAVDAVASVCILDTGVNQGHPLLNPILAASDCQAVDPDWGSDDHDHHGTLMAGVAAYGDLNLALATAEPISVGHRLESVKILPRPPRQNAPNLWGYITSQAISRAEIQAPNRKRTLCLAITADDTRDRGRPSSWSAMLDQLACTPGAEKLILVSAGNTSGTLQDAAQHYPGFQLTDSVHDPAQAWNALTVGAYTELTNITDDVLKGYKPVAADKTLSPFTTTSTTWEENKWPLKPELVMEGGNLAVDAEGFATNCDDLSLLSTWYQPTEGQFYPFAMTSAATAQLAWMTAQIRAEHTDFWEETIRGLLVHTAEWPEALKRQFVDDDSKTAFKHLLGICGYGVPNLQRALYSAQNSLTLIAQEQLQPYGKSPTNGRLGTKDMHVYDLPWPVDVLKALPDETPVQMRITLSYFIEPAPGEVGWKDRYRYASHGLRFELNSPNETKDDFVKRINIAARAQDEGAPGTASAMGHWLLGSQARDRGSIHSDIWQGTAAELAVSNLIGVSPVIGWWRERSHLNRWDSQARYALIVSINTPDESVDIYTPVAQQLNIPVSIEIPT